MTKYNYSFKLQVVKSYLNGEGGYKYVAAKYNISNESQVRRWVNSYTTFVEYGLEKNKYTHYPIQFKLDVTNYMLTNKYSLRDTANHFGINNISLIYIWKQTYLTDGIEALSKREGDSLMVKNKSSKNNNLTREQQLEHENELLRTELAFIKKLRTLGMDIPERLKTNMKQG